MVALGTMAWMLASLPAWKLDTQKVVLGSSGTWKSAIDPEYLKVFVLTPEGQKIVLGQPEGPKPEPSPQEPSGDTSGGGEEPSPSHGEGKPQD